MLAAGDIVLAGFPYAEKQHTKYRPALVVSDKSFHETYGICWVAMITSAENEPWASDVRVPVSAKTGLNKASVIRPAKLATLDAATVEKIGVVPRAVLYRVTDEIFAHLAKR